MGFAHFSILRSRFWKFFSSNVLNFCVTFSIWGSKFQTLMAPRLDFSNWWAKDTCKGNPVVVTMENPNFSSVEIDGLDFAFRPVDKSRGKNAKQVTWVLLLNRQNSLDSLLMSTTWRRGKKRNQKSETERRKKTAEEKNK